MCQLLGLSSNKDVDIQLTLREFQHRGEENPHGWGFAFCLKGKWKIIKEPKSLKYEDIQSEKFKFKSKIIIGHVRSMSCGKQSHPNTHPFQIGKWVFAHNGTVKEIMKLKEFKLTKFKPEGDTDSEYAFCYLIEKIDKENNPEKIKEILKFEAEKIKKYGAFNFVLSDGEILYAYGDNSLYYVKRKAPFQEVTLKDDQYTIHLAEIKSPDEEAILIATEPFTINEQWQKFSGLKIFKSGKELN
jgi:glutamine amidotransferase